MSRLRFDPFDDPVVRSWDAWVSGDHAASDQASPQAFAAIDMLATLSTAGEPDVYFLASLEKRLIAVESGAISAPVRGLAVRPPARLATVSPDRRVAPLSHPGRWAIAALLAICMAGTAMLFAAGRNGPDEPQHIPAAVDQSSNQPENPPDSAAIDGTPVTAPQTQQSELLLHIQVDPDQLNATPLNSWDRIEFSQVTVQPGESFTTDHPYFSCCAGIAVFQVREGSASFVVDGPADVYSGSGDLPPVRIGSGTLFALTPGETAVFAMDLPAVVTNTDAGNLILVGGFGYDYTATQGSNAVPDGYRDLPWVGDLDMEELSGDIADFQFERVELAPGRHLQVEVTPDERLLSWHVGQSMQVRMAFGALDALPDNLLDSTIVQSMVYSNLPTGTYTAFNTGDDPVTLYFMRLAAADSSTSRIPVASQGPQSMETLLDIELLPAEVEAAPLNTWSDLWYGLVTVKPGESFNTDNSFFKTSDGIALFQVLEGSASFVVDGPALLYADSGMQPAARIAANALFTTVSGQTAAFATMSPAVVTNTGFGDLIMLHGSGYAYLQSSSAVSYPDGYNGGPYEVAVNFPALSGEVASIQLERVTLAPDAYTHIEVSDAWQLVGWLPEPGSIVEMAPGRFDALPDNTLDARIVQSIDSSSLPPGDYTLFNTGNKPAVYYFMRLSGESSDATPVDVSPSGSPVAVDRDGWDRMLNAAVNPSLLDFEGGPAWDSAYLAAASLPPASGTTVLGCCDGVHVLTVLEGDVAIELMAKPIQAFLHGENSLDQNLSALQAGESVIFGGTITIANQGEGTARYLVGGAYPGDAQISSPVSLMSIDIDQTILQPGESGPLTVTANDALRLHADQEGGVSLTADRDGHALDLWSDLNEAGLEPGDYLMTNTSSAPVTVFALRIGPDLAPPT